MACIIFGAGSYYGLTRRPEPGDYIIAADGGWQYCKQEGIVPDLLPISTACRWKRMTAI